MTSSLFCGAFTEVQATAGSLMKELADNIVDAAEHLASDGSLCCLHADMTIETGHKIDRLTATAFDEQSERMKQRPASLQNVSLAPTKKFHVQHAVQHAQHGETDEPQAYSGDQWPALSDPRVFGSTYSTGPSAKLATRRESEKLAERLIALLSRPELDVPKSDCAGQPQPTAAANTFAAALASAEEQTTTQVMRAYSSLDSQRTSFTRLKSSPAANPESLRVLVQEKNFRDQMRITAQVKKLEINNEKSGLNSAAKSIKSIYASLSQHSQALVTYFRRLKKLEKELFTNSR